MKSESVKLHKLRRRRREGEKEKERKETGAGSKAVRNLQDTLLQDILIKSDSFSTK